MSKLSALFQHGLSLWLADLDRRLLSVEGWKRQVAVGIRGLRLRTQGLSRALVYSPEYDETIRELVQADHEINDTRLYEWLRLLWTNLRPPGAGERDLTFLEALIGADTAAAVSVEMLSAVLDHAAVRSSLAAEREPRRHDLEGLNRTGIHLDDITSLEEADAASELVASYDAMLAALRIKRAAIAKAYAGG